MLAALPSTRAVNACSSPRRSASSSSRSLTGGTVTPRILPRLLPHPCPRGAKDLVGPCSGERLDQLGHAARLAAQADLTCRQPPPRGRSRRRRPGDRCADRRPRGLHRDRRLPAGVDADRCHRRGRRADSGRARPCQGAPRRRARAVRARPLTNETVTPRLSPETTFAPKPGEPTMSFVSRGFRGRRRTDVPSGRVPPGQYVTDDFPVLSAGPTPHTPLTEWTFSIDVDGDPLEPEHGGPARLLVPHLYFWKSASGCAA